MSVFSFRYLFNRLTIKNCSSYFSGTCLISTKLFCFWLIHFRLNSNIIDKQDSRLSQYGDRKQKLTALLQFFPDLSSYGAPLLISKVANVQQADYFDSKACISIENIASVSQSFTNLTDMSCPNVPVGPRKNFSLWAIEFS